MSNNEWTQDDYDFWKELAEHCKMGDLARLRSCKAVLKTLAPKHSKLIRRINRTIKEVQNGDGSNYEKVHEDTIKIIEAGIAIWQYALANVTSMY